jgi:IMP dehydrogenase
MMKEALCFDDILLVPQNSTVGSRHTVDLSMSLGSSNRKISLYTPVIAAPMDTVCDVEMCKAMAIRGGLGILHRYMDYEEQILKAKSLVEGGYSFGVALASNNGFVDQAKRLYDSGVKILLIDTANGHGIYAGKAVYELRKQFDDVHIMAGNVATYEGFRMLAESGADSVRVGIGGGSVCTTRIVSGHGVPTAQSISDIADQNEFDCSVVADGGMRNSGDIVKAFALGADTVMLGSMLAGTDEAPGDIMTDLQGHEVKVFRGMASAQAQREGTGRVSVSEGVSTTVSYKGSVMHVIDQIRGGLGSGCSYSGCHSLSELHNKSEAIRVSSLSVYESKPHAQMI